MDLSFLQRLRETPAFGAPPLKPVGLRTAVTLQCGLLAVCTAAMGVLALAAFELLKSAAVLVVAAL